MNFPYLLSVLSPLPTITPFSSCALQNCTRAAPASAAWPTADKAFFYPFRIATPYQVRRLWWLNGSTITGVAVDIAIYTKDFTRLTSVGATAQATVNVVQAVTVDILLSPGTYYLGISAHTTGSTMFRVNPWAIAASERVLGVLEQTAAHPLPAIATPVGVTAVFLPMCGLASRTTL